VKISGTRPAACMLSSVTNITIITIAIIAPARDSV
jgi:hypothetical protein